MHSPRQSPSDPSLINGEKTQEENVEQMTASSPPHPQTSTETPKSCEISALQQRATLATSSESGTSLEGDKIGANGNTKNRNNNHHHHIQSNNQHHHHHNHHTNSNSYISSHSMKKDHTGGSSKSNPASGMNSNSSRAGPTGYRPGRLTPLEILERVFPLQRRSVLELVLQGCNGDLVKAIEHFISAQDTVAAQHQAALHANNNGASASQRQQHQNQQPKQQQSHPQQTPQDISGQPGAPVPRPNPFISSLAAAAASSHAMFGHHHLNVIAGGASIGPVNNSSNSSNLGAGSTGAGPDKLGFPLELRSGSGHTSSHHHPFHTAHHHHHQQHTPPAAHTGSGVTNKLASYSSSSLKSAFTPLSAAAGAAAQGLHAAFTSHLPHFHPAEAALRNSFFAQTGPGSTDFQLPTAPHLAYAGLGMGLGVSALAGPSYPSMFGSPFSFHPYRLNFRTSVSPRVRTPDKNSDKSALTDSDHISDSWDEAGSPRDGKAVD